MDITKVVAKMRLDWHLNMVDVVNVANQLGLMSNEKADRANANHLRKIIDCGERLAVEWPETFKEFAKEES